MPLVCMPKNGVRFSLYNGDELRFETVDERGNITHSVSAGKVTKDDLQNMGKCLIDYKEWI